jgi:diaminopimelate decarboxylase
MSKYIEVAGLDASMPDLMRPGMYGSEGESSQHQITVLDPTFRIKTGPLRKLKVVGSLCEGNDVFAFRELPDIEEGDIIIIHDTGAHGHSMGFNYNARLRHAELVLRTGQVVLVRRAETYEDYMRTQRVKPVVLKLAA